MSASLVGSEMCIRDSRKGVEGCEGGNDVVCMCMCLKMASVAITNVFTVSYTHLTLPTICSV
eukprot:4511930-Alexandrium_andersonii.AAC.1